MSPWMYMSLHKKMYVSFFFQWCFLANMAPHRSLNFPFGFICSNAMVLHDMHVYEITEVNWFEVKGNTKIIYLHFWHNHRHLRNVSIFYLHFLLFLEAPLLSVVISQHETINFFFELLQSSTWSQPWTAQSRAIGQEVLCI